MSSLDRFNDLHKTTNLKSEPSKCKCCEKKKKLQKISLYCSLLLLNMNPVENEIILNKVLRKFGINDVSTPFVQTNKNLVY